MGSRLGLAYCRGFKLGGECISLGTAAYKPTEPIGRFSGLSSFSPIRFCSHARSH